MSAGGGPKGAGLGVKLLIGAGALAYGVKEATYTGIVLQRCNFLISFISNKLRLHVFNN